MNSFGRALKLALAHRVNVLGCVLTSLAVAVLWGGNLTAVFPVVDVIMNDHSLPEWIDEKIAESDNEVAENQRWLAQLDQIHSNDPAAIKERVAKEIKLGEAELEDHQAACGQGVWNDIQIAEQTRLTKFIENLQELEKLRRRDQAGEEGRRRTESCVRSNQSVSKAGRSVSPGSRPTLIAGCRRRRFTTLVLVCVFVLVANGAQDRLSDLELRSSSSRIGKQRGAMTCATTIYRQVLRLDMANFTEQGRGDLMNRCTSDLGSRAAKACSGCSARR